jgi:hypothetical protein
MLPGPPTSWAGEPGGDPRAPTISLSGRRSPAAEHLVKRGALRPRGEPAE